MKKYIFLISVLFSNLIKTSARSELFNENSKEGYKIIGKYLKNKCKTPKSTGRYFILLSDITSANTHLEITDPNYLEFVKQNNLGKSIRKAMTVQSIPQPVIFFTPEGKFAITTKSYAGLQKLNIEMTTHSEKLLHLILFDIYSKKEFEIIG